MVIWGGTWPSAKAIAEVASPEVNVFWRFLLTSVAFLPILLATRSSLRVSLRGLLRSGNLLFLAAAGLWAALTLLRARTQREIPFLPFSFLMYAVATLFAFPVALTGRIGSVFSGGNAPLAPGGRAERARSCSSCRRLPCC